MTKFNKIIITGINGFVGYHLTNYLNGLGVEVVGVGREKQVSSTISNIVSEYHQADLIDIWPEINNIDAVIHLAGLAAVGPSFDNPQKYINANTAMLTNLCEYYIKQNNKPRIIAVSSGAVYDSTQKMPIPESGIISFSSPYTISKVCNENQVAYYNRRGLDCIIARPLNHIGPGQLDGFLVPDLYNQIKSLNIDQKIIKTGNINTKRDYTDVRDIARAYASLAMAEKLNHRIYNICSGRSLSGIDIFNELKNCLGIDDINYEIDPAKIRPTDALDIYGDYSRINTDLGWEPSIDINQTISDFISYRHNK